jgi:hypothetical protein
MSHNLMDLVFYDLNIEKFTKLIFSLKKVNRVASYSFNFKELKHCPKENIDSPEKFKELLSLCHPMPFSIRFDSITQERVKILNCSIISYFCDVDDTFEVIMNFDDFDVEGYECKGSKVFSENLLKFAKAITKEIGIDKYCCGVDPAEDESTQFFNQDGFVPKYKKYLETGTWED